MLSDNDLLKKLKKLATTKPPEVIAAEELVASGYTCESLQAQMKTVGNVNGTSQQMYLVVLNNMRDIIKFGKVIPKSNQY